MSIQFKEKTRTSDLYRDGGHLKDLHPRPHRCLWGLVNWAPTRLLQVLLYNRLFSFCLLSSRGRGKALSMPIVIFSVTDLFRTVPYRLSWPSLPDRPLPAFFFDDYHLSSSLPHVNLPFLVPGLVRCKCNSCNAQHDPESRCFVELLWYVYL